MKFLSKQSGMVFLFILGFMMVSCGMRDPSKPGYEVKWLWTDMMYPVSYEAYSENPVFNNKMTLQQPVAGTVHRNAWVVEDPTQNPFPATPKTLAQGQHLYQNFCMHCHGVSGQGDGPVSAKLLKPPVYTDPRLMAFSSKNIFDVITNGKGVMPSHAKQIDPLDRWKIVRYIEKLQGK